MIYFLSRATNEKLVNAPNITQIYDVNKVIKYFKDKDIIAVDTETTGFDPYTCKLLTLQLGDNETQFVINTEEINPYLFKELLEEKTLILQNAKFDLRFFYHYDIWSTKVYDTFLAEVKLNHGIPNVRKNLQALAQKYCDTEDVDKSLRGLIHRDGLTPTVVEYAANDVKYLHLIKEKQENLAREQEVWQAIRLENRFVPTLAYIEYSGIYIDKNKWKQKVATSTEYLNKTKETLDNYIIKNNFSKYIDSQLDLFSTEKKVTINWNSEQQVKKLFKDLGINITINVKGVTKESVEASVLKSQKDKFPIINLYLEYKKWEKDVSTYGLNFLKHINRKTGRIHTNFTQIVDTGRMASGGKNKQTGEEYVNLQNIPATPEYKLNKMVYARECFVPQHSTNVFVNADYSGQEQIVLVNKSQDKDLIDFYVQDLGDMHSFVASKIFPELKELSLKEIKKFHKDKRQIAKSAGFALNYGGTGWTISNNLSIPKEQGEQVEKAYFEAFPGLKDYYDKCEKGALDNGYILIDNKTGSKFYIAGFDKFSELRTKVFNDKTVTKEERSYFWRWKSQIRRNALNYPIQGTSANITKYACFLFFDWLIENNYQNIVKIVNVIHDEILLETPQIISETVAKVLKNCMETAGNFYCTTIPLKAEPEISSFWNH